MSECPFCDVAGLQVIAESGAGVAFRDRYPVSSGHTLIIPRRHVATIFDLDLQEELDLWQLVREVKRDLDVSHAPTGYNVGHNAGPAAGQTVGHAHVHVIPRFDGDVPDPRGGIRWVIPENAAYWDSI